MFIWPRGATPLRYNIEGEKRQHIQNQPRSLNANWAFSGAVLRAWRSIQPGRQWLQLTRKQTTGDICRFRPRIPGRRDGLCGKGFQDVQCFYPAGTSSASFNSQSQKLCATRTLSTGLAGHAGQVPFSAKVAHPGLDFDCQTNCADTACGQSREAEKETKTPILHLHGERCLIEPGVSSLFPSWGYST